jgi:protocatechuate 3,4-dioxygenase, alpha subunit
MPERLTATPGQTIGPFFHYALPYERGNQLVPGGSAGSLRLHGTVYDGDATPIPDALVEIRQADPAGRVPSVEGSRRRDGSDFTGWGRCATDTVGRYSFTTVEPGPVLDGGAAFFSVVVFARGLLNRLFTRAYLPDDAQPGEALAADPLLASLGRDGERLVAVREESGDLRFDLHLQGDAETPFLTFPGHEA